MIPCFSRSASSQLIASLMEKGTGRGLKNFGMVLGGTCSVAAKGVMRPISLEKSG